MQREVCRGRLSEQVLELLGHDAFDRLAVSANCLDREPTRDHLAQALVRAAIERQQIGARKRACVGVRQVGLDDLAAAEGEALGALAEARVGEDRTGEFVVGDEKPLVPVGEAQRVRAAFGSQLGEEGRRREGAAVGGQRMPGERADCCRRLGAG
ncbi:hypothetical protein GCM10007269_31320 [Microbacterium murale]|uniref:Uncharacterized protein n=1 Tax=Microbacterium murale TaxID=1081040 RepID=A0ABQ1RZR5_9MICO|nr:hypothetical protein GCM10007269_31320 [Microbacterium murale]